MSWYAPTSASFYYPVRAPARPYEHPVLSDGEECGEQIGVMFGRSPRDAKANARMAASAPDLAKAAANALDYLRAGVPRRGVFIDPADWQRAIDRLARAIARAWDD